MGLNKTPLDAAASIGRSIRPFAFEAAGKVCMLQGGFCRSGGPQLGRCGSCAPVWSCSVSTSVGGTTLTR